MCIRCTASVRITCIRVIVIAYYALIIQIFFYVNGLCFMHLYSITLKKRYINSSSAYMERTVTNS